MAARSIQRMTSRRGAIRVDSRLSVLPSSGKAPLMITALRQQMHQDLQLAGLSERTQEAYLRAVRQLADHFHQAPDRLSESQRRHYLLHLKDAKQFAPSSL